MMSSFLCYCTYMLRNGTLSFPPQDATAVARPFAARRFVPCVPPANFCFYQTSDALGPLVQIETKEIGNADEIAAVSGVDNLFMGPFDLGNKCRTSDHRTLDPADLYRCNNRQMARSRSEIDRSQGN